MMKKKLTLLTFCGLLASATTAQVNPSIAPDMPIAGSIQNTGIAIAPDFQWNAIVHDHPGGVYYIEWWDPITGTQLYLDKQAGYNPDVAYYANPDNVNVSYENAGMVWVDDYYYTGSSPLYMLGANNPIAPGYNSNIDMNSLGQGILTWEDAGTVWMCCFSIGPFMAGPIVPVAGGAHPDVALLDNGQDIVLTYQVGGVLMVETYDYPTLCAGGLAMTSAPTITFPGGLGFSYPRVQANRNSAFGPPELYTVVAQDNMGGGFFDVTADFFVGVGTLVANTLVNAGVSCAPSFPLPVVAYQHDEVHVAFAQNYTCSSILSTPARRDVLMVQYDFIGVHAPGSSTPFPGTFQEVNNLPLNFTFSSTSLNTEYDGNYTVMPGNYCEGVVFNDPGDLFWKKRDPATPFFRTTGPNKFTVAIDKGVSENTITVEVSAIDETLTENDLEMSFQLYDQSGRLVDVPTFEQEGMIFTIDATSLEHGIYLLHYTLNGETKAERIPHFAN
jgi:hypothetical protein